MQKTSPAFLIEKTGDIRTMQELFLRNGLEATIEDYEAGGGLGLWRAVDAVNGRLLGGLKMEERSGELVLSCIAVEEATRNQRVGATLLSLAINFAKERQAERLLLVAKTPKFFKKFGFYSVDMEDYKHITKCHSCAQRGISCHPEILCMDFLQVVNL